MTTTEITLLVGLATLVVERIATHFAGARQAEAWVRKWFDVFAADIRREHEECRKALAKQGKELTELRETLSFITPDRSPAE